MELDIGENIESQKILLTLIKNKNVYEIKEIFKNYTIKWEKMCDFVDTLSYLLEKDQLGSMEFILEENQKHKQNKINEAGSPYNVLLFKAILKDNFKAADLLLKYGARLDAEIVNSKNILEHLYLYNEREAYFNLTEKRINYILKKTNDFSLVTLKVFEYLLRKRELKRLFEIKCYDIDFIKNLLFIYKAGKALSDDQLNNIFFYNNKSIIKLNEMRIEKFSPVVWALLSGREEVIKMLISSEEVVKMLIDYAIRNHVDLEVNESNESNNSLDRAIELKKVDIFQLLINYAEHNKIKLNYINRHYLNSLKISDNSEILDIIINYTLKHHIIIDLNKKLDDQNYPLLSIIWDCKVKVVQTLIDYANQNGIVLKLNDKNNKQDYPVLRAIDYDKIEVFQLLIDYANKNGIVLNVTDENCDHNYPLLSAVKSNDEKLIQLLIDYADQNDIVLNPNGKDKFQYFPLIWAVRNRNVRVVKLLMDYTNAHNIILDLNLKNESQCTAMLKAIKDNSNVEIVRLLVDYAKQHHYILDLQTMDDFFNHPLLSAILERNMEILNIILEYAEANDVLLPINEIYNFNGSPILAAIKSHDSKMLSMVLDYTKRNHIKFDINANGIYAEYPLVKAVQYDDIKCVQLLVNYAKETNTPLRLNDRDQIDSYPLIYAARNNNIEMVELLLNYAKATNSPVNLNNDNEVEELKEEGEDRFYQFDSPLLQAAINNNLEIIKLLANYARDVGQVLRINPVKGSTGTYPLLESVKRNCPEIVEFLMAYAEENNIELMINKSDFMRLTPLSLAINNENTSIVRMLIDYAKKHGIELEGSNLFSYRKHSYEMNQVLNTLPNNKKNKN